MADIEIHYFPARARAEPLRLMLTAAGKKFKDVRIPMEQWFTTEKAKSPYGTVPYMIYNKKTYGETKAIATFLARECGMAGKNNLETLRVEEVYSLASDLSERVAKMAYTSDKAEQAKLGKTLNEEIIPRNFGNFEKMLKESGKGYFVSSGMTLADLAVQDITVSLLLQNPKVLDGFPEIKKMKKNVEDNPKIKAYIASRPASPI